MLKTNLNFFNNIFFMCEILLKLRTSLFKEIMACDIQLRSLSVLLFVPYVYSLSCPLEKIFFPHMYCGCWNGKYVFYNIFRQNFWSHGNASAKKCRSFYITITKEHFTILESILKIKITKTGNQWYNRYTTTIFYTRIWKKKKITFFNISNTNKYYKNKKNIFKI